MSYCAVHHGVHHGVVHDFSATFELQRVTLFVRMALSQKVAHTFCLPQVLWSKSSSRWRESTPLANDDGVEVRG